jgi:hypothetical protein
MKPKTKDNLIIAVGSIISLTIIVAIFALPEFVDLKPSRNYQQKSYKSNTTREMIRDVRAKYVGLSWDGNISLQEEIYDKYGGYWPDKERSDPGLGVYYYNFIEVPITMCIIRQRDGTRFIHDFEKGGAKQ